MLGHDDSDALRTERFVNDLMADGHGPAEAPLADASAGHAEGDAQIQLAARALRANLIRVHPSFRFEEGLAERLAAAAAAAATEPGTLTAFPAETVVSIADRDTAGTGTSRRAILPAVAFLRIPEVASRPSRPLIVGGVGVASAAISIGAVYVAWRHSRPSSGRMGRAVRAAHDRTSGSGRNRRSGSAHGIFGVLS